MNSGQKRFYIYIKECTKHDELDDVVALLKESFQKQNNGTFDKEYLRKFNHTLIPKLKDDKVDEVTKLLHQFGTLHVSR